MVGHPTPVGREAPCTQNAVNPHPELLCSQLSFSILYHSLGCRTNQCTCFPEICEPVSQRTEPQQEVIGNSYCSYTRQKLQVIQESTSGEQCWGLSPSPAGSVLSPGTVRTELIPRAPRKCPQRYEQSVSSRGKLSSLSDCREIWRAEEKSRKQSFVLQL